jgi:hypothetical protein
MDEFSQDSVPMMISALVVSRRLRNSILLLQTDRQLMFRIFKLFTNLDVFVLDLCAGALTVFIGDEVVNG